MLRKHWVLILILGFTIILKIIFVINVKDLIWDEHAYYIPAAKTYLAGIVDSNPQHPPLGKEILALGISLFGDNSLGWRFFPILAGLASMVITYLIAWRLSKRVLVASLAIFLLGFEPFWFFSSSIAYLEIFLVFFSLLAMLFLLRYMENPSLVNLAGFSVSIGAGLAVKWSAALLIPAALILIIIFGKEKFFTIIKKGFLSLLIVGSIYVISYIPFLLSHSISDLLKLQAYIYNFHANLTFERVAGYYSFTQKLVYSPFRWLFTGIDTYDLYKHNGTISRLAIVINPMVFYGGLFAFFFYGIKGFLKRDFAVSFLVIIIAFLIFPWFLVKRVVYFYYLLTAIPFFTILISIYLNKFLVNKKRIWDLYAILATNGVFFILLLPYLVAIPIPSWYLGWLFGLF